MAVVIPREPRRLSPELHRRTISSKLRRREDGTNLVNKGGGAAPGSAPSWGVYLPLPIPAAPTGSISGRLLLMEAAQPFFTQCFLGCVGLALVTVVFFKVGGNLAAAGFAYLIVIALLALMGSFIVSIVLSILAAGCLSYFFA